MSTPDVPEGVSDPKKQKRLRQDQKEKEHLEWLQRNFDVKECKSSRLFLEVFGFIPSMKNMKSLVEFMSSRFDIKRPREVNRRRIALMHWFDEHYDSARELIKSLVLELSTGELVGSPEAKMKLMMWMDIRRQQEAEGRACAMQWSKMAANGI